MKITFIQTGGTIDKDYPRSSGGWAFEFGEPATKRILERLNPSFEFEVITSCQKDSLEITDDDRQAMVDLLLGLDGDRVIITHGTDTMMETATYLAQTVQDKVVIITGAMRPERFSNSDAPVNLGAAIAAVQVLENGVYITMHGVVKPKDEIKRDTVTGKYY